MRLGFAGAAVLGVAALAGCTDRDVRLFEFDVVESLPEMAIDGNPLGGVLTGGPSPVTANMQAEAEFQQQDLDYIARVSVTDLRFRITANSTNASMDALEDGNPDTFDFLDSVEVQIEAAIAGQVRTATIASLPSGDTQLGNGSTTIVLTTTGVDILAYVQAAGGYTLRVLVAGSIPPDDVLFDGVVTYRVIAGLDRD